MSLKSTIIRAKDSFREKTLAKKQNASGDGSAGNSEESDGVANVRYGQSSSLLRSRVTYGSFYLRMGAMCE